MYSYPVFILYKDLMFPAYTPNFAEAARTTQKVEQVCSQQYNSNNK